MQQTIKGRIEQLSQEIVFWKSVKKCYRPKGQIKKLYAIQRRLKTWIA